jgi:hypothetical protein
VSNVIQNPVFSFHWLVGQLLDLSYWWAASALAIRKILSKMLSGDFANLFVGEVLSSAFLLGSWSPHSSRLSGSVLLSFE